MSTQDDQPKDIFREAAEAAFRYAFGEPSVLIAEDGTRTYQWTLHRHQKRETIVEGRARPQTLLGFPVVERNLDDFPVNADRIRDLSEYIGE